MIRRALVSGVLDIGDIYWAPAMRSHPSKVGIIIITSILLKKKPHVSVRLCICHMSHSCVVFVICHQVSAKVFMPALPPSLAPPSSPGHCGEQVLDTHSL